MGIDSHKQRGGSSLHHSFRTAERCGGSGWQTWHVKVHAGGRIHLPTRELQFRIQVVNCLHP